MLGGVIKTVFTLVTWCAVTVSPNMRVGGCEWVCTEGDGVVWACAMGAGGGASLGVCTQLQRAGDVLKTRLH